MRLKNRDGRFSDRFILFRSLPPLFLSAVCLRAVLPAVWLLIYRPNSARSLCQKLIGSSSTGISASSGMRIPSVFITN